MGYNPEISKYQTGQNSPKDEQPWKKHRNSFRTKLFTEQTKVQERDVSVKRKALPLALDSKLTMGIIYFLWVFGNIFKNSGDKYCDQKGVI